jgi:hypothetical protein
MTTTLEFKSLYEYLSRPAGSALGYAIATRAKKHKEPIHYKDEPASPYPRPISMYRVEFLQKAFSDPSMKTLIDKDVQEYRAKRAKKVNIKK